MKILLAKPNIQTIMAALILISLVTICSICQVAIVNGIVIETEVGSPNALSTVFRSATASGQGTHANFVDPKAGERVTGVMGDGNHDGRWAGTSWNYYADGFGAEFPEDTTGSEDGKIFTGAWASAQLSHKKLSNDVLPTDYIYDGVTANSDLLFEFEITGFEEGSTVPNSIPVDITVNVALDVQGAGQESGNLGRATAKFSLEQGNREIRSAKVEMFKQGSAETRTELPPLDWSGAIITTDDQQIGLIFNNVLLKPNQFYQITLRAEASTYDTFYYNSTVGESAAYAFIDPRFQFSPDFQYADNYKIVVSSGLINAVPSSQSRIAINIEQGGNEVAKIATNGGLVTCTAATQLDPEKETKFIWSAVDPKICDTDGKLFDSSFTFDPSGLQSGSYSLNLVTFPPLTPNRGSLNFEIVSGTQSGAENSSGGDLGTPSSLILVLAAVVLLIAVISVLYVFRSRKKNT
jgi:hypothetical protein